MKDHFHKEIRDYSRNKDHTAENRQERHAAKQRIRLEDFDHEMVVKKKPGKRQWDTSCFPDNKLLHKWIEAQVGKNWDKIYSEIKSKIKDDSILNAIKWIVDFNIKIIDGKPYVWGRRFLGQDWYPLTSSNKYKSLYVDPNDNILKVAPCR